ncbi:hypothetical protein DFH11DRAFT_1610808, partial [Phellopilus nigrolimitatus]
MRASANPGLLWQGMFRVALLYVSLFECSRQALRHIRTLKCPSRVDVSNPRVPDIFPRKRCRQGPRSVSVDFALIGAYPSQD